MSSISSKDTSELKELRAFMVKEQIESRGISDSKVLFSMENVPRHLFVPENLRPYAYEDRPLPIGMNATISQPYIVGLMTELLELKSDDRVLEIGTGSGYQAAVIGKISAEVVSFERIKELVSFAKENLKIADVRNVKVFFGDGTDIPEDLGEFDCAIVTAASPDIPKYLFRYLKEGARLVVPVGNQCVQELLKIKIHRGKPEISYHGSVRFVPLIGDKGWN